jgi:hypothetical protein
MHYFDLTMDNARPIPRSIGKSILNKLHSDVVGLLLLSILLFIRVVTSDGEAVDAGIQIARKRSKDSKRKRSGEKRGYRRDAK